MQTTDKVQTGDVVTGTSTSTSYTYSNHSNKAEKGWECPRCGRINAPWKSQCDCAGDLYQITCDDSTTKPWWNNEDTFRIHPYDVVYTTAYDPIVGGSDYWDQQTKTWTNTVHNQYNGYQPKGTINKKVTPPTGGTSQQKE